MLRDIGDSAPAARLGAFTVRKLSVEDLFLVKLDTGREKDQKDLPALFQETTVDRLVDRFNAIWKWHGDRNAVVGYADRFVAMLHELGGCDPLELIGRLKIPAFAATMLKDAYGDYDDKPRP